MPALRFILLACMLLLAACSRGESVVWSGPADGADRAVDGGFEPPSLDVPGYDIQSVGDASRADTDADIPDCMADRDCLRGQRCLQNHCSQDICLANENPCGADRCEMRCVPVQDLCAALHCGPDETCFAGRCVQGCFPAPCSGVQCPAGQFCDDGTGACAHITPCPARCADGFTCDIACLPRSPCDSVTCAAGEVCVNGLCAPNPCAGVTCPAGALCIDGHCTPTCGCDPPCNRSPRDRCVVGHCQCTRLCSPDTPCGADDGCGGRCVGPCSNPFATCDPVLYSCDCARTCRPDMPCGAADGCGGRCDQGCDVGERCDTARQLCVCVTRCPAPERFGDYPCGSLVPNLCTDGPPCGTGTLCGPGQRCNTTTHTCDCITGCDTTPMDGGPPSDAPPGGGGGDGGAMDVTCAPGLTPCGGRCVDLRGDNNHCGTCGVECPFGTACASGVCVCPTPLTLCGEHCVNTDGDSSNCGMCGTICAGRTYCSAGTCTCTPACTVDPNSVACGTDVANACPGGPSCGIGRECPSGQVCDTHARRCVCVPRCPPGVRCGVADGCGDQCAGACDAGAACTQDPTDIHHYFCSAASCVSGCRCDEVCAMNRCVRITCASGDVPCPCQCCPLGEMCVGGSVCAAIPP